VREWNGIRKWNRNGFSMPGVLEGRDMVRFKQTPNPIHVWHTFQCCSYMLASLDDVPTPTCALFLPCVETWYNRQKSAQSSDLAAMRSEQSSHSYRNGN